MMKNPCPGEIGVSDINQLSTRLRKGDITNAQSIAEPNKAFVLYFCLDKQSLNNETLKKTQTV